MPRQQFAAAARGLPVTWMPMTPRLRARIEATIDNLVALLDEIDGDADFEPDPVEGNGDERDLDNFETLSPGADEVRRRWLAEVRP